MELIMDTIQQAKAELRKKIREMILHLTSEDLKRRSINVVNYLSSLPIYQQARVVLVYFPIKGEVDLLAMIRKDLSEKRFCFPVVDAGAKEIKAVAINDLERDFLVGPYGIKQPDFSRLPQIDSSQIDLVIVPGLAFDRQKNRLGRGAGYYDRFLSKLKPTTKKIGVAFDFQIQPDLPNHPESDIAVDFLVSESFVV